MRPGKLHSPQKLPPARALAIRLVEWFDNNARDLPWRQTRDPYAIWVSEVMLQQTLVTTVISYWSRWMAKLPDIRALATEPEANVLKLWEGLGYYRRARNLQAAAQVLMQRHAGAVPTSLEGWLELPGIGRYTAGAIMSIAFNHPVPAVDGNVIRVLSRLEGITTAVDAPGTIQAVTVRATALVQAASRLPPPRRRNLAPRCSALNQSLMELGATLCTPRGPDCPACPIRKFCVAFKEGLTGRIPVPARRKAAERRSRVVVVLEAENQFLVRRCPVGSHNECLWEFPSVPESPTERTAGELALGRTLQGPIPAKRLGSFSHSITRYRIKLEVWLVRLPGPVPGLEGEWVGRSVLGRLAFSAAHRKIIRQYLEPISR